MRVAFIRRIASRLQTSVKANDTLFVNTVGRGFFVTVMTNYFEEMYISEAPLTPWDVNIQSQHSSDLITLK
jgi:hypothetical protein